MEWGKIKLNIKKIDGEDYIFDLVRKKNILLTPEEEVRQSFILYIHQNRKYPLNNMAVEKSISYNKLTKRPDLIVYKNGIPLMLAEFKSPQVKVDQKVLQQIAIYNFNLRVPYWVVSNGIYTYIGYTSPTNKATKILDNIPFYDSL